MINVTGFKKTDPICTLGISRITNLKIQPTVNLFCQTAAMLNLQCSYNSYVFSQYFIAMYPSQLTLVDFEQLFHSDCNTTDGGRVGGGWSGWWAGEQPEAGHTLHEDPEGSVVSSVSVRNRFNPRDKLRLSLSAVWHHSHLY